MKRRFEGAVPASRASVAVAWFIGMLVALSGGGGVRVHAAANDTDPYACVRSGPSSNAINPTTTLVVTDPAQVAHCEEIVGYTEVRFIGAGINDTNFQFPLLRKINRTNAGDNSVNIWVFDTSLFHFDTRITFPNVKFDGDVFIQGNDNLTSIGIHWSAFGDLIISGNPVLSNLSGCSAVNSLQQFTLLVNPMLEDISPFWNLTQVTSNFELRGLGMTTHPPEAFPLLTKLGQFKLGGNQRLETFYGFPNVVRMASLEEGLTGQPSDNNPVLTTFAAFPSLVAVIAGQTRFHGRSLSRIEFNATDVFSSFIVRGTALVEWNCTLYRSAADIEISANPLLTTLGFPNLAPIALQPATNFKLIILDNPLLSTIADFQINKISSLEFRKLPALRQMPNFPALLQLATFVVSECAVTTITFNQLPAVNSNSGSIVERNPALQIIHLKLATCLFTIQANPVLHTVAFPNVINIFSTVVRDNQNLLRLFNNGTCTTLRGTIDVLTIVNNTKLDQLFCTGPGFAPLTDPSYEPRTLFSPLTISQGAVVIDAPALCCFDLQVAFANVTFVSGGTLTILGPCTTSACNPTACRCIKPTLVSGSLRAATVPPSPRPGSGPPVLLPLNSTAYEQEVLMDVYSPTDSMAFIRWALGPASQLNLLTITDAVAVTAVVKYRWTVKLTLGPAFGSRVFIATSTPLQPAWTASDDSLSYPPPRVRNGTAQLVGSAGFPRSFVHVPGTIPDAVHAVQFEVANAAADPRLRVTYGPAPGGSDRFVCTPNLQLTTDELVVCSLQTHSTGVNHVFTVYAADQSTNGTDTVSFLAPTVTGLVGCHPTLGCPTAGGITVTVTGTNFVQPISIPMGTTLCGEPVILISSTAVSCVLPAGTGQQLSVVANTDGVFSSPQPILTYASPQLFRLFGCTDPVPFNPLETVDCPRAGARITLIGLDFGPSGAVIYIGTAVCTPIFQNATYIVCDSGPGNNLHASVSVIQQTGIGTQSTAATVSFHPCQPGSYEPAPPNQYNCNDCGAGKFSSVPGALFCTPCAAGSFTGVNHTTQCTECPRGRFYTNTGATACTSCTAGSYGPSLGLQVCVPCAAGKYTNTSGEDVCTPCRAGTAQPIDGRTTCDACDLGSFSATSPDGITECARCPLLTMGPFVGLSNCYACPPNSISSFGREQCECVVGYYSSSTLPASAFQTSDTTDPLFGERALAMSCHLCPSGAVCNETGISVSALRAERGWFRVADSSVDPHSADAASFVPCLQSAHCAVGGCAANRNGPLCARCDAGYEVSFTGLDCNKCPAESNAVGATSGYMLLLLLGLGLLFFAVWKTSERAHHYLAVDTSKGTDRSSNTINTRAFNHQRLFMANGGAEAHANVTIGFDVNDQSYLKRLIRVYTTEIRSPPNYTYQLKLLLSYVQMVAAVLGFVELPWPSYFQSFMGSLTFVNLDFVPWSSLGCAVHLSYYVRMCVYLIVPFAVIAMLATLPRAIYKCMNRAERFSDSEDSVQRRATRRSNVMKFRKLIVFALFLVYPLTSNRVFSFFMCRKVGDSWYLLADFNLECYDSLWYTFLPVAIVGIIVYPIGIPALVFSVLYRHRGRLYHRHTLLSYSLIYDAYTHDFWYFEMLDMLEKLIITSLLGFLPAHMQCPGGMLVVILYLIVVMVTSPFLRSHDDRLSLVVQLHLFLMLAIGYTLQHIDFVVGSVVDVLASFLMFIILALLLSVMGYHLLIYIRKSVRAAQRREKQLAAVRSLERHAAVPGIGSGGTGPIELASSVNRSAAGDDLDDTSDFHRKSVHTKSADLSRTGPNSDVHSQSQPEPLVGGAVGVGGGASAGGEDDKGADFVVSRVLPDGGSGAEEAPGGHTIPIGSLASVPENASLSAPPPPSVLDGSAGGAGPDVFAAIARAVDVVDADGNETGSAEFAAAEAAAAAAAVASANINISVAAEHTPAAGATVASSARSNEASVGGTSTDGGIRSASIDSFEVDSSHVNSPL